MKDIFYEESASSVNTIREENIYKFLNILSWIVLVAGVGLIFLGAMRLYLYFVGNETNISVEMFLTEGIAFLISGGVAIAFVFLINFFKRKFNKTYDYTFVSGEIRITEVTGNKRKLIYELKPSEILKIGKTSDSSFYSYSNNQSIQKFRFTPNKTAAKGKDFYYVYANGSMGKSLLILECRETLIVNASYFLNKSVFEG